MRRRWFGQNTAGVAFVTAAVRRRIGVEHLTIIATGWYADAIVSPHHRGKIADANHLAFTRERKAHESNDILVRVVRIDPLKATRIAIALVQCGFVAI